ncbi:hypothetical protein GCM10027590_68820 [Nocardiopsis nanhaiensis]
METDIVELHLRSLQRALESRRLHSKLAQTIVCGEFTPTLCCDPYLGSARVTVEDQHFTFLGVSVARVRVPVDRPAEAVDALIRERCGLVPMQRH